MVADVEERKLKEMQFHDKQRLNVGDSFVTEQRWSKEMEYTINVNPLWTNMKYYSIERKSRAMVLEWFRINCLGKRVLDYCCGNGDDALIIANYGAQHVLGIDISEVSIKNCNDKVFRYKHNNVSFLVRDAEDTGFENDSFDVITEYGALHHLDLHKAFSEMTRILRPNGKIICTEALGHNPIINLYRRLTPHLRTEWEAEHILCKKDLDIAHHYFDNIELHFYHLFTIIAVPFRNTFLFSSILKILEYLDSIMLKIPGIKWQAWQVVFVMSGPKKK